MGLENAPEDFARFYRAAWTRESKEKARLFGLQNGRLIGIYLDRRLFVTELTHIFGSVKDIVLGSALTDQNKKRVLGTLADGSFVELSPSLKPAEHAHPPIPTERPSHWTPYQYARLKEVHARAENIYLRAESLDRESLTRQTLEVEVSQLVSIVEGIIGRFKFGPREMRDIKSNLEGVAQVCDLVARAQNSGRPNGPAEEQHPPNGTGPALPD